MLLQVDNFQKDSIVCHFIEEIEENCTWQYCCVEKSAKFFKRDFLKMINLYVSQFLVVYNCIHKVKFKCDLKNILAPMGSVLLEHVEFHSITTLGSSQPDSQKFTGGAKHYSLNLNLVESCLLTSKWNLNNELENSQLLKLTFSDWKYFNILRSKTLLCSIIDLTYEYITEKLNYVLAQFFSFLSWKIKRSYWTSRFWC